MCNQLHQDSKPIPKEGIAYKLFGPNGLSLVYEHRYAKDSDGWIRWDTNMLDGFCALSTLEEAKRAVSMWEYESNDGLGYCSIKKDKYRDGLGQHKEDNFTDGGPITTIIVKTFKILEEIPREDT